MICRPGWRAGATLLLAVCCLTAANPGPSDTLAANPPERVLELSIPRAQAAHSFRVQHDPLQLADQHRLQINSLPALQLRLAVAGAAVIVLSNDAPAESHPFWTLHPGTGTSTSSPDGEVLQLPFALLERNANCSHNGQLQILRSRQGALSGRWQVKQQTCAYLAFTAAGELTAAALGWTETPATAADAEPLQAWHKHQRQLPPRRPVAELDLLAPGLAAALAPTNPEHISAWGVWLDGRHYSSSCSDHNRCEALALPSYSLAKALVGGLGLIMLEQQLPKLRSRLLTSLVPECADPGWAGVTLEHLADMTSGRFASTAPGADEDRSAAAFLALPDHHSRLAFACTIWPAMAPPGSTFVYHTTDSYLLGTAMQRAWQDHIGAQGDFFRDLLVQDIWQHLALSRLASHSQRTEDGSHQPLTGLGLLLEPDDVVALGRLLLADLPVVNDDLRRQFRAMLEQGRTPAGVLAAPAGAGLGAMRYHDGVWALDVAPSLGCSSSTWLPFLSGYGGITVLLLPDSRIWYQFSDSGQHQWLHALRALHQLHPVCTTLPAAAARPNL